MAMATFAYSGRTRAGQTVTGERIAETVDAAVAALRRDQILVTQINPVKEKAAPKAAAQEARAGRRPEEPGGLHAPVLRDDRRRPAARAVSRDPRHAGGGQELRGRHPRHARRRRKRRVARRRDEEAPEGLRPALHQHDRRRRSGRYSRHDSQAAGHLHREGGQAEGAGQVGDDLPDRRRRDRQRRRRRDSVEGHSDVREPVRGPRRGAAAADARRHRAQQRPGALRAVPHRRHGRRHRSAPSRTTRRLPAGGSSTRSC